MLRGRRAADPERVEHRKRWAEAPFSDRRAVMKSVNRGRAMESRKQALLAVGQARHQQRFWRYAWLLGPLVSLIQVGRGWDVFVFNAAFASLLLGAMSLFWLRRARRAEILNRQIVEQGVQPKKRRPAADGHLPSDQPAPRPKAPKKPVPERGEWPSTRPDPNTSKAKLARRKKRR